MKTVRNTPKTLPGRTNVGIDNHVYERLKTKGIFGETFSQVIERLLNRIDEMEGKKIK